MKFWIMAGITVVVLGLSYGAYWIAFYNPESRHAQAVMSCMGKNQAQLDMLYRQMEELPYEEVSILSHDGLRLWGKYYHVRDGGPVHIQFHGYRGSGLRDFCAIHRIVREAGINTLVVDQRSHGKSQGNTMTFGILERQDCLRWAQFVQQRFGDQCPIYLSGVSMGAATVLMASSLPLPENVVGIMADCPYSSPKAIICKIIGDMKLPSGLLYPFAALGALLYGRFMIWKHSAVKAVQHTKVPILLIHGSEDRYVPSAMSSEIYENCQGQKYLELFPGAAHGGSCVTDAVRYAAVIKRFMELCRDNQ